MGYKRLLVIMETLFQMGTNNYSLYFRIKSHAIDQDKPLVNVHKSLWEVIRTCSHEEVWTYFALL